MSSAINASKVQRGEKSNCDDRKWNMPKVLQQCDKTPTRTKNVFIMKKDLQCDRCGYFKSVCDETNTENRCTKGTSCHVSDEQVNSHFFKDNATFKSTNCKLKSESTHSLRRSSTFNGTTDIHLTIRRRVVYAQVLLEAFGNAAIALNSNSSRFVSFYSNRREEIFRINWIFFLFAGKLFWYRNWFQRRPFGGPY